MSRAARIAIAAMVIGATAIANHASAGGRFGASNAAASNEGARDLEVLLARLDRDERDSQAELDTIAPRLDVIRKRMIARGRVYYRYVRAGLLPAGGGFDALVDHATRVERTRMALERDLAEDAQLVKREADLTKRLEKVRAEKAPLAAEREAMVRARAVLAEADERKAAFARAFESSTRPDNVAIYGADVGPSDDSATIANGFRALKGHLRFPISGRAEVHKVMRRNLGGPGLELHAALGSAVRSVAPGRVAFADRYDDYGLTVIVDHGDHYYSVYGNLGAVEVKTGDPIQSGARLGSVGSEGDKPPMLYLELRHKSETIDPSPWLGL